MQITLDFQLKSGVATTLLVILYLTGVLPTINVKKACPMTLIKVLTCSHHFFSPHFHSLTLTLWRFIVSANSISDPLLKRVILRTRLTVLKRLV